MRRCRGPAGPGSERGRRRAAWRRAGDGLRPEARGRPPPRSAPPRAQARRPSLGVRRCGPRGGLGVRAAPGPGPGVRGRGVRRAPPSLPPPRGPAEERPPAVQRRGGGDRYSRRRPRGEVALLASCVSLQGWRRVGWCQAAAPGGGGGPGASSERAPPPPPSYALARTRPENWNPGDVQQPRSQVLCIIRLHV